MKVAGRPVDEDLPVRRARNAVYAVFFSSGFIFASWASRIPQVRAELGVGPGVLGLVLLSAAVGAALGTPLSGLLIGHETRAVRPQDRDVHLIGAAPLCGLYAIAIAAAGGRPILHDEDAAADGLALIGRSAEWT